MTYNPLRKPRLRFCLRATVNALLAFGLAHLLAVPWHGLRAVLTAVMIIQMSIGGSLKAAGEYIIGTIAGALYAGALAAVVPHATVLAFAGLLALAIAPLAYAAAVSPSFRAAPVTAVLVLMISAQLGETPIELAFYRSLEVAIGSATVIAVSLLVFPARAHELGLVEAGRVLEYLARVLPAVLAGFRTKRDPLENARIQDDIGEGVHAFAEVAREAKPERLVHFAPEPDPAVLARTLLRLRHDLVMIGRAASAPAPGCPGGASRSRAAADRYDRTRLSPRKRKRAELAARLAAGPIYGERDCRVLVGSRIRCRRRFDGRPPRRGAATHLCSRIRAAAIAGESRGACVLCARVGPEPGGDQAFAPTRRFEARRPSPRFGAPRLRSAFAASLSGRLVWREPPRAVAGRRVVLALGRFTPPCPWACFGFSTDRYVCPSGICIRRRPAQRSVRRPNY